MDAPVNSESIDVIWDYNDPSGTETRFREFLEQDLPPSLRAEALTQLARTFSLRNQFDEANRILDEAENLGEAGRPQVRLLLERGRTLNSAGEPSTALPLFMSAWVTACELGEDALAVDAAHMVAIVKPEPADQIEWNERGLELSRKSDSPRAQKWRPSLLNNLAWTYHDMGDPERALALFEEAQQVRQNRGDVIEERIARYCIGRCLRTLGRIEEARAIQTQVVEDQEGKGWGYAEEEMGECLMLLNRPVEAKQSFAVALEKFVGNGALHGEPERLDRIKNLAEMP